MPGYIHLRIRNIYN